ncbi:hypothetical protein [Endothiovibrio diazotrophicus]
MPRPALHFILRTTASALLLWAAATTAASLEPTAVPARDTRQSLVRIEHFGRYAITAESGQGTALQLVERMTGPGPVMGRAGERDGRIDRFLDRGEYRLLTHAHPAGEGEAKLALHPFVERNPHPAPRLIEQRLVSEPLADFEQRSYWLDIKERRTVVLEAAGRSLADLRLWRDGEWLIEAQPAREELTPAAGRPLTDLTLVTALEPGLYRVTAYGGPALPWAEESAEQPFHLRLGIPKLGEAGNHALTASPFGRDRWRLPASANYVRLALPEAEAAALALRDYRPEQPLAGTPEGSAAVSKKSVPPVAELTVKGADSGWRLLTVSREAGKPYRLQHFRSDLARMVSASGRYWVGTLQSGHGEDLADATALIVYRPSFGQSRLQQAAAIELDHATAWQRRFNLAGDTTLHLEVKEAGEYTVTTAGVQARLRLEPLILRPPRGYQRPPLQDGSVTQTLDPGFYRLTLQPDDAGHSRGIVTLGITAAGREPAPAAAQVAVHLPGLEVTHGDLYTIYCNRRPGVTSGLVIRPLPIDLEEPLPLALAAGETVELELSLPGSGRVELVDEEGRPHPLRIDDRPPAEGFRLDAGRYRAQLANAGRHPANFSLQWLPDRLLAATPLPPLSSAALARLPAFPPLRAGEERFLALERDQRDTVGVTVGTPGLYRLESTGLLHTEGTLRSRVVTDLERAEGNGSGRNFLITRYLDPGDYQLTTRPLGLSRGEAGLRLTPIALHDGGELSPGVVTRRRLPAGEGVRYAFHITDAGDYRLRSLDLHDNVRFRLEDADGWPLIPPGREHDVTRRFAAGDYRLVLPPQPVESRVITLLEAVRHTPAREGHGPHPIALDGTVRHLWREPAEGSTRDPDRWRFTLPAAAQLRIDLGAGMVGELHHLGGAPVEVATVYGNRPWHHPLPRGEYELAVRSQRPDQGLPYTLTLRPDELLAGMTRRLAAPGDTPLAIGEEGAVEIASFGQRDLRATLYDDQGRRLADGDDRPGDWNFLLATRLAAGRYRLQLEPVGSAEATTEVSLRTPSPQLEAARTLPARLRVNDTRPHTYPLQLTPAGGAAAGGLLLFSATAADSVGLALERREGTGWRSLGSRVGIDPLLALPLRREEGELRLQVWSASGRPLPITVDGRRLEREPATEAQLAAGLALQPVADLERPVGVASVALEGAGSLQLTHPDPQLQWGAEFDTTLGGDRRGALGVHAERLWLVRPLQDGAAATAAARRLYLAPGEELALTVAADRPTPLDLAAAGGEGVRLLLARSSVGQPGLRLDGGARAALQGAAERQSALLLPAGAPTGLAVLGDATQPNPIPVRLALHVFAGDTSREIHPGDNDLTLAARVVLRLTLPEGAARLELTLPPGVAAELLDGDRPVHTLWSGSRAQSFEIGVRVDGARLYNTADQTLQATARVISSPRSAALTPAEPLIRRFAAAGVWVVPLPLPAEARHQGVRLALRGAHRGAQLVQHDGRVHGGERPAVDDAAMLQLHHGAGIVAAWLATAEGATTLQPQHRAEGDSGSIRLHGASTGVTLHSEGVAGLELNYPEPVLLQWRGADGEERLSLEERGAALTLPLTAGDNRIALYGVDGPLSGDLQLHTPPLVTLREGIGDPLLLPPGGSRLFRITLPQPTTIGLGIDADRDEVGGILFDAGGRQLGEGLVQMHELAAGDYLFRIAAPADGPAVTVHPVLVGTELPDAGTPPAEVVRKYLREAGIEPR